MRSHAFREIYATASETDVEGVDAGEPAPLSGWRGEESYAL